MELARGIEPPTGGLQNGRWGIAQVVDDMGSPSFHAGISNNGLWFTLSLFVAFHTVPSTKLTPI